MRYTEYRRLLIEFVKWQEKKQFLNSEMALIPYELAEMFLEDLHDCEMARLEDGISPKNK